MNDAIVKKIKKLLRLDLEKRAKKTLSKQADDALCRTGAFFEILDEPLFDKVCRALDAVDRKGRRDEAKLRELTLRIFEFEKEAARFMDKNVLPYVLELDRVIEEDKKNKKPK